MKRRATIASALALALALSPAGLAFSLDDAQAHAATSQKSVSLQASSKVSLTKTVKNGLVKKGSYRYYYKNGKMVKKAWKTIKGARYYFQKNGRAATGSVKISGKYYVFSATGKLAKGTKTRVVTVKSVKYQVTKAGRAKSGWNSAKTYYYQTNGAMFKNGKKKIGSKTYCFGPKGALIKGDGAVTVGKYDAAFLCANSKGVYDSARTNLLKSYAVYQKECAGLLALLGTPKSVNTYNGCNMINGELANDVTYTYAKFKVGTFKVPSGKEYFAFLEAI